MRIVTWNVRQGGGRRRAAIASASAAFAADVIVLSEYQRDSKVPDLKSLLADHGYSEWADSAPNGRYLGVAIAANKPLDEAQALEVTPPWAGLAAARVDGLLVVGVYGPGSASHLGDNRPIKGQWWNALLEKVDAWKDDACVMVGDFNTGAHGRDEKGQTFVASDKFEALLTHGFRDAWREKHGEQAQQWSWWSNQGGGYRLDHCFVTGSITVRSAEYQHRLGEHLLVRAPGEAEGPALSDHAALVVDLGAARSALASRHT